MELHLTSCDDRRSLQDQATMRNNIKTLIVDHSRLFRALLADVLQRHGYSSVSCTTGGEALTRLKTQEYELICASYHLIDMSGETFCRQVRDNNDRQNSRIILFTAEENESLLKRALLAGATDIYSKHQFAQFEIYLHRLATDFCNQVIGQVLLIEDTLSQSMWLKKLLTDRGLEVEVFSDAEQALAAFETNAYDLVITDIVLEGAMSGLALVREIRRNPSDKGLTPILAISAYDNVSRRLELYHVGVNDYMTKPVIAMELFYRATNLIHNRRIMNELNAERRHLQEIALLDPVTGLYNRNAFDKLAFKELANAERNRYPISLAILDIDYFKSINDNYGHDTGDEVLADVGSWLRNVLRKGDMVFRWGGEEFVMILLDCTPEQAFAVLEKQRTRFNKAQFAGLKLTVSIGISGVESHTDSKTLDRLFKQADEAVYHAKSSGRNRISINA